ncbi:uncharacterized protein LOC144113194 [Amblyomma americanum]
MAVVIGQPAVPNSLPKETSVAPLQECTALCPMSSVDPLSLPSGSVQCRLISPEILASTLRMLSSSSAISSPSGATARSPFPPASWPSLADNSFYTWQHGSSTISDMGDTYKNKPGTTHLGHGTVTSMEILPLQILQLSATKRRGHWVSHAVACATLLAPFVALPNSSHRTH